MEANYSYPKNFKKLRACLQCHLIKTEEQFKEDGCENCVDKYDKSDMINRITPNFKGMIAITNPKYSWCAKWLDKRFYCTDIINDQEGEEENEEDEYEDEDQ